MVMLYVPIVVTLGIIVLTRIRTGIAIADFTRDPLQIVGAPVYTGIVSSASAVIWSGTAAVCLFSFAVVRGSTERDAAPRFLLAGGLVTTLLLVDDFFLLHEIVFPRYVGVPEKAVQVAIAGILVWFVVSFRTVILRTDYLLLALACGALGVSTGLDFIESVGSYRAFYLFEDGAKLFGIVNWAAYFVLVSAGQVVSSRPTEASASYHRPDNEPSPS